MPIISRIIAKGVTFPTQLSPNDILEIIKSDPRNGSAKKRPLMKSPPILTIYRRYSIIPSANGILRLSFFRNTIPIPAKITIRVIGSIFKESR